MFNHHFFFDAYAFFICFVPNMSLIQLFILSSIHRKQMQKFVFVNYSNCFILVEFYDKAIALDIKNHHTLLSFLFILHKGMSVNFTHTNSLILKLVMTIDEIGFILIVYLMTCKTHSNIIHCCERLVR